MVAVDILTAHEPEGDDWRPVGAQCPRCKAMRSVCRVDEDEDGALYRYRCLLCMNAWDIDGDNQ
jgi:hypothetical protein